MLCGTYDTCLVVYFTCVIIYVCVLNTHYMERTINTHPPTARHPNNFTIKSPKIPSGSALTHLFDYQ